MPTYEFNGVINYAHCFSFEIIAKNKREAIKKSKDEIKKCININSAEFTDYIIDEPKLLQ